MKTRSVGAHSICARGSLPYRKRARADMESAPTFFVAGGVPSQRRCPAWSCLPLLKARSVGAHSICARGGLSCRKRARADMEFAPTFFCGGRSPLAEAVPRVELSPFVESEIRRGAFYMRPRKFALPQAGTGGYGIRPYVFCGGRSPLAEAVPRVELSPFVESEIRRGAFYMRPRRFILPQAGTGGYGIRPYVFCRGGEGRVFACCACKRIYFRFCLVKNHLMWYTISLQVHRQTRCKPATQSYRGPSGQPVANKKLLFYCRR